MNEELVNTNSKKLWISALLVLVVTFIVWGVSMKKTSPFSPGQTLGYGFLIGGISGALFGAFLAWFNKKASDKPVGIVTYAVALYSVVTCGITFLIFKTYPQDAMIGFAISTIMCGLILYNLASQIEIVELWSVLGVLLSASVILAINHFDKDSLRNWWYLPLLMGLSITLAGFVGSQIGALIKSENKSWISYATALLTSAIIVIGLSAIFAWKIVGDMKLLQIGIVGSIAGSILFWLISEQRAGFEKSFYSIFLVLAVVVSSFAIWSGLGISIALICICAPLIILISMKPTQFSYTNRTFIQIAAIALSVALLRLFLGKYGSELGSADLRVHYSFIGALMGAMFPFLIANYLSRFKYSLAVVLFLGLLSAAIPLVLFIIWGIKIVLGIMYGISVAIAFSSFVRLSKEPADDDSLSFPVTICALAMQLSAVKLIGLLLNIEQTRALQIWTLSITGVVAICWIIISGVISSRKSN